MFQLLKKKITGLLNNTFIVNWVDHRFTTYHVFNQLVYEINLIQL